MNNNINNNTNNIYDLPDTSNKNNSNNQAKNIYNFPDNLNQKSINAEVNKNMTSNNQNIFDNFKPRNIINNNINNNNINPNNISLGANNNLNKNNINEKFNSASNSTNINNQINSIPKQKQIYDNKNTSNNISNIKNNMNSNNINLSANNNLSKNIVNKNNINEKFNSTSNNSNINNQNIKQNNQMTSQNLNDNNQKQNIKVINQAQNQLNNNNPSQIKKIPNEHKPLINKNMDFTKMSVVDAVNYILITSADLKASDIHFDPCETGIIVRIRIDGLLNNYFFLPMDIKQNIITRIKIMAGMNITETRLPQDGKIKTIINKTNLDLRVSSLPTKKGEKIVIRILDYTTSLKGIEYLSFNEINYHKVVKMLQSPNGIILVTGATGTGKSTTLYSFLQRLNDEKTNIITVEDPVEMEIKGINQVQVNSEIGLDFATVLRSILRQDPNVIMIGEIRDSETAKIAVRASITGHLVLSTIHTNNSLNTIERLQDMDVERYLLASALMGIVSQLLARKLCDKCKIKRKVNNVEKELFNSILGLDIKEVYDANKDGCPYCNHGYKGRIALHEVLLINQDIRDAISSNISKEELRNLVYNNNNVITMLQDGLYKVIAGFTTVNEILKLIELDEQDKKK